jgi:RNA polymerase sigma-70 factor (ECF subfamily)
MNRRGFVRRIDVDQTLVDEARAGHAGAFAQLAEPYRRELQVHCYRMLGSVEDAEDAVQETYLRAWAKLDSFAARASFRAWMYGIASHVCLDALRRRKSRAWPTDLSAPADPNNYELGSMDLPWLQPYPDRLLNAPAPADEEPEAVVTARETIELAFLAAIQQLPARQRAVLILRDVLDWSAKETAAALDMSAAAVNSALQRAHATLAERRSGDNTAPIARTNEAEQTLLHRLIAAWEGTDLEALVGLLSEDARLVMPPAPMWFAGRDALAGFFREHVFGEMSPGWRLIPTAANLQPAFALYWREAGDDAYRAFAICVLRIRGDEITEIDLFHQPELFASFALPATLPATL